MVSFEEYKNTLYIDIKEYIYRLMFVIVLFLSIKIILRDIPSFAEDIILMIYIVQATHVLLLAKFTDIISNKKFFEIVSCFNVLIILISSIILLSGESFIDTCIFISGKIDKFSIILTLIMAILFTLRVNYITRKKFYSILLLAFITALIYVDYKFEIIQSRSIISVLGIIAVIILLNNIISLKNYYLIYDGKINYITMENTLLVIYILLLMYTLFSSNNKRMLLEIINAIFFVFFSLSCSIYAKKLLSTPYNIIFKDLYEENQEIDKLNKRVFSRNRELEFSQKVMLNKESILRNFFRNVPIPLIILNSTNERILFANTSFGELVEVDNLRDIINKKLFSIVTVENNPYIENIGDKEVTMFRTTIKLNNSIKYVDMEIIHILDDMNEKIVIFRDFTSTVKANKMKETMQNKKLDEKLKSDFLSNISHDLKTPINVIYSATQVIKMYIQSNNEYAVRKYNNVSKQNCISLIRLTNNIIDTSRIYADYLSPNLRVKNIVDVVEEVVTSLIDYAKSKDIDLVFDTNEEEVYVNLDDEFMQRIILNLVSNAIKFTKKNGVIEIIIEAKDYTVDVNINDNGIGMEKSFIENAFNRYSMGKNNENSSVKGTGIGLFVVKRLVEKQNGEIAIDSVVNKGTNIKMTFNREEIDYAEVY